ncbi:MAG: hypothetical protein JWL72_2495 [Ilumatobacteraceae bacterium]|nr:hypothetical protein [Ilumatobacteraceae bacterium]
MDYDAIAAHFLVPNSDTPPPPELPSSDARRLRDALEPIATIGWWSREASAAVNALGHDFFDGYVWGRAASLGADVAPSVVVAAFGVFEPAMLGAVYAQGRSRSTPEAVLAAREDGAAAGLAAATSGVSEAALIRVGDDLLDALESLDGSGRPLFSALRALPTPTSVHGRAWRAAELVREHRGDGHIAAFVAAGLTAVDINVLTEVWLEFGVGEYSSTRAFAPDRITAAADRLGAFGLLDGARRLTDAGRIVREEIEAATDASQSALIAALGDGLAETIAGAEQISAAVLAAHAAPADPRKRAAG